jgi:uncharacterized protein (TIGR02147 family)
MVNIYDYTNFREYLKDSFEDSKKRNNFFSHRFMAEHLGLSTPNLVLLIMQGKRNLTRNLCFKLSNFLRHTKREALYFDNMVSFLQAKTSDEKNKYLEAMFEIRHKVRAARIDEWQYRYYDNWYNPVIRELVTYPDFNGNLNKLSRKISPPISVTQVKKSIKILLELGLIKKKGTKFVQKDALISTGPEVNSFGVVEFHRKTSRLAAESFDRHKKDERDLTSCTLTITKTEFEEIKKNIADLRKKTMELAQDGSPAARVYQLNLQLFPLSLPEKRKVSVKK